MGGERRQRLNTLIWGAIVIAAGMGFARFGYTVILPFMQNGLAFNYTQMGMIGTANFIGYFIGAYICGLLADCYGKKRTIQWSLFMIGVTLILTGIARDFWVIFILRLITGIFNASAFVIMLSLGTDWAPAQSLGRFSGILVGGVGLGITLSSWGITPISAAHSNGWIWSWYLLGAVTLLVMIGVHFFIKDRHPGKLVEPLSTESRPAIHKQNDAVMLAVAANFALLVTFIAYFMEALGYVVQSTFYVAFLRDEAAVSPLIAGNVWSVVGIGAVFSGLTWGTLADRFGIKRSLVAAYLTQVLAILLPVAAPYLWSYLLSGLLFGNTFPGIVTITSMVTRRQVTPVQTSRALGLMTAVYGLGQFIAPGIAGWMTDATRSFTMAFYFSAAVVLLGCLMIIPVRYDKVNAQAAASTQMEITR
jgi:MFS family permease